MSMSKTIEYKGSKCNITVELNYMVERSLNGRTYHQITSNDMGQGSFYRKREVLNEDLIKEIEDAIRSFEDYVDNNLGTKTKDETELKLIELGFK